jgi:hypothetical protein
MCCTAEESSYTAILERRNMTTFFALQTPYFFRELMLFLIACLAFRFSAASTVGRPNMQPNMVRSFLHPYFNN